MKVKLNELTPREIVSELDKYIIGQNKAKKSVAIALRNRWRRARLPEEMQDEVSPKNIIMIGPTGVGKTEIARRITKLTGLPFIKVEATKFTEVGYVGRDAESMIRDLMAAGVSLVKQELQEEITEEAEKTVEEELLNILLPSTKKEESSEEEAGGARDATRESMHRKLREGELDERKVEISVSSNASPTVEIFAGSGLEEINFGQLNSLLGKSSQKRSVTVKKAKEILLAEQKEKLIDDELVVEIARERVQNMGIIFIDEIDKIIGQSVHRSGNDISREGVQRDMLPIIEGSTVNTKFGPVDTTHILFIAAGAFSYSKPSDLIPELQGRFPLRVELEALSRNDFEAILINPKNALIPQYRALMETEGVKLTFEDSAVKAVADTAQEINRTTENIGARRLHTLLEKLLEELAFTAPERRGEEIVISQEYVMKCFEKFKENRDLSRYIL